MEHVNRQTLPPMRVPEDTYWPRQQPLHKGTDGAHCWGPCTVEGALEDTYPSNVNRMGLRNLLKRPSTSEATRARVHVDPKKRKRPFQNRSKNVCNTCRKRKKKCDEARPACSTCRQGGFICEGYANNTSMPKGLRVKRSTQPRTKDQPLSKDPDLFKNCPGAGCELHQEMDHPRPSVETLEGHSAAEERETRMPSVNNDWQRGEHTQVSAPRENINTHPPPVADHTMPPHIEVHAQAYQQQQQKRQESRSLQPHNPPTYPLTPQAINQAYNASPIMATEDLTRQPKDSLYRTLLTQSIGPPDPLPVQSGPSLSPRWDRSEKDKMIGHEPFMPYDTALMEERYNCKKQLLKFNFEETGHHLTLGEGQRTFRAVVEGKKSICEWQMPRSYPAPGHVGQYVHVDTPFHCDYGYHLVIGDMVTVGRNCAFLDSGKITIGRKTRICANVTIDTQRIPTDSISDKGSRGYAVAAEVIIGENCYIGANVTIKGPVEIGPGAIIYPGSVVTDDVGREVIVSGSPAQPVGVNPHGSEL